MVKLLLCSFFLFISALCRADTPPAQAAAPVSEFDQELAKHINYHHSGRNLVGYLPIDRHRAIDQSTYLHAKFALQEYVKRGVIFVILRLDTPGGEVFSAMKIAELLQEMDAVHHIPIVAVINNWALSAGAMLAYSCRFIVVSDNGIMGAAEPVMSGGDGKMESAPEKIVSALRTEFGSLAKFYGRNPLIAEAMVDKDIILVKRDGNVIQLHDESQVILHGNNPDVLLTARGKLLTLDSDQLMDLKVANLVLPIAATHSVTDLEKELGEWPASQSQLFAYPFFTKIPLASLIYYTNWKIDFFSFLTNPIVASLLMMGLMIGIYMEMSHPGFGFPGVLALICFGLILLSSFATEAVNWLEIIMVVLGVCLFLVEIFVLPGFGVIGLIGVVLILFGLTMMFIPDIGSVQFAWNFQDWNLQAFEFIYRLGYTLAALVLSLLAIAIFARFVTPRLMKKSPFVLRGDQRGSVAGPEIASLPPVDAEGEAFTSLRPGGKVLIKNQLYDALADSGFIERGEKVIVVKIQGSAIIVAKK